MVGCDIMLMAHWKKWRCGIYSFCHNNHSECHISLFPGLYMFHTTIPTFFNFFLLIVMVAVMGDSGNGDGDRSGAGGGGGNGDSDQSGTGAVTYLFC